MKFMISFQRARQIAYDAIAPTWAPEYRGNYMVADYGFENAHAWLLVDGAREMVIDGDYSFEPVGRPSTLVEKDTGQVFHLGYLEDPERFDAMTQVGLHPSDKASEFE